MSLPVAPPSPVRAPARRRWPWLVALAIVTIAVIGTAIIVVRRDSSSAAATAPATEAGTPPADPADRSAELRQRLDDLLREPSGAPDDKADPDPSPNPLEDLLGGGEGLAGVDPACVLGEGTPTPKLRGGVEGDVAQQVTQIAELVEEERGLRFDKAVQPEILEADAFDQRIADLVKAQYPAEQADLDGRVLQLLGAIPKGTDLKALQQDLLSGQVAGYYDPETGEVVVRVPEGQTSLDATSQITLAHELDHALTDQALGLPDTEEAGASDANLARLALVEGDATLLMQRFSLRHIGLLDQLQGATGPDAMAAQEDLQDIPPYLRNELMFPYLAGLTYACRLQDGAGWPGVDAAYRQLPATTAEVLFADAAAPQNPADVPALEGSWDEARRDTLGAASLLWLFQAPGGDEAVAIGDAEAAAKAWAGGELALFTDGPRSALGLSLVDASDDARLCEAVEAWFTAAFDASRRPLADGVALEGGEQVGVLRCDGDAVRLGIAPDLDAAGALTR